MKILIMGAPGSGVTTLGAALSKAWAWPHLDTDDYEWVSSAPPFVHKTNPEERRKKLLVDMDQANVVVSGSVMEWGKEVENAFSLIVFLNLETNLRIKRIKSRDDSLYGGTDPHFLEWAASYETGHRPGRSRYTHEAWLRECCCQVLRLEGELPLDQQLSTINSVITKMLEDGIV
ncbi:hypothetical protein [Salinicola sp. NYA28a]